jgi:hypothetical protein
MREWMERNELNLLAILERRGGDMMKLTASNLTTLLSWHWHPKLAGMKKEEKLAAWLSIVSNGKTPQSYQTWTAEDDPKLKEAQSDIIDMAHTHLGHLETLKKKELMLAALTMMQEGFNQLTANRRNLIAESGESLSKNPPKFEMVLLDANELIVESDLMGDDEGIKRL